jgi:hypothetical protein
MLRIAVWTIACVSLGIALGTVEVFGKTPVQHVERVWKQHGPRLGSGLEKVKGEAGEVADEVKKKVAVAQNAMTPRPTEQHPVADRAAIDELIAKRQR